MLSRREVVSVVSSKELDVQEMMGGGTAGACGRERELACKHCNEDASDNEGVWLVSGR